MPFHDDEKTILNKGADILSNHLATVAKTAISQAGGRHKSKRHKSKRHKSKRHKSTRKGLRRKTARRAYMKSRRRTRH